MVATVGRCYTNPKDYAQDNYYTAGDCFANSEWLGKACTRLGLSGQIQEAHFLNAYQFLDPQGLPLRRKLNYGEECKRQNRPGTDVTLSAPKSISVAALVFKESGIIDAHSVAVRSTMEYVEKNCIYYQAKQKNKKLTLQSRTAQIATFLHDDNRNKDPQLHTHCVVLNQTLCPDGKWRAVANRELYMQSLTIGAYYAHELAREIQQRGWEIRWTQDHIFELACLDKDQIDTLFSTRSKQIEAELSKSGLTRGTATAAQKQTLCLKTRPPKKQNKHPEDRERQLDRWRQKALGAGLTLSPAPRTVSLLNRDSQRDEDTPSLVESACITLIDKQGAFYKHELLRECLRLSRGRYDTLLIEEGIERYEALVATPDGRLTTAGGIAAANGSFPPGRVLKATVMDGSEKRRDPSLLKALELLAIRDGESVAAYRPLHAGGKLQIFNDDEERICKLVSDYVNRPAQVRERTKILTSNDGEKERITALIRAGLISCGALGDNGITVVTLRRKKINTKSVSEAHHYRRGDVIKFAIENAHFSKDCFYRVTDINGDGTLTLIDTTGAGYTLPLSKYKQRDVYSVVPLKINPGERMRFTKTRNASSHQQLKGRTFTVEGIGSDGRIAIVTGRKSRTVSPEELLYCDYSYVDTLDEGRQRRADYCIYWADGALNPNIERDQFYRAIGSAKYDFVAYIRPGADLSISELGTEIENTPAFIPGETPVAKEKDTQESPERKERPFEPEKPQTSSNKEHQTKSAPLVTQHGDAELIARIKLLKEWEKNAPVAPLKKEGKNLNLRIESLNEEKTEREELLELYERELSALGSPRSFFNPFGAKLEEIEYNKREIRDINRDIVNIERKLKEATRELKTWKEKEKAYRKWLRDTKTKEMQQFSEQLESDEMQKRLRLIESRNRIYDAANSVLTLLGHDCQGGRYFEGKLYRILKREKTLQIYPIDSQESLYAGEDKRDTEGIVEVSHFALTLDDIKIIFKAAKTSEELLEKKRQEQDERLEFHLGR